MKIYYLFLLYYLRINKNQASKVFLNFIPFYLYIIFIYFLFLGKKLIWDLIIS